MRTLQAAPPMLTDQIERSYRQATGKWTGCDWATEFGTTKLNLNGLTSEQAVLLARATSGRERADWQAAVTWLSQVEYYARMAEDMAKRARDLALDGDLANAILHADTSCAIEGKYHSRLVWQPLREAIEVARTA